MKKLILTSFCFNTGENRYNEQRLVVVENADKMSDEAQREQAEENLHTWFNRNYPESELHYIIGHETIHESQVEVLENKKTRRLKTK